jgi:protein O-mannosyl-transferase
MSRRREQPRSAAPKTWERYAPLAVCVFLVAAVAAVYCQTIDHNFVNRDDDVYVLDNKPVRQGLTSQGIAWAMTTGHGCNWHPLTWFSHMLDCQLYGLHAGGHHVTSVLLHAANVVLLFLVFWRMTGDLWPSAFVAAVFAVHPLRVESVAWVSERKDVLSGLFFMLTLAAYLGYVRQRFSLARYLLVVLCFGLGLMAKPMLVTVPFVLLLLDYWPLGRTRLRLTAPVVVPAKMELSPLPASRLIVEKVPLLLMTIASCVVTSIVQTPAMEKIDTLPLGSRMANALVSYVSYLGQFFWPTNLTPLYPHPGENLAAWKVLGSLLLLLGISAGVGVLWRRIPALPTGWLWYLGMLVPVIGLVQVGSQAQADRYTYLPQIGLAIALAWGATYAARSWPYRRYVFGVASALALAALMACAWRQTTYWRDGESLWIRAVNCTPENNNVYAGLAGYYQKAGKIDAAIEQLQHALALKPDDAESLSNLGAAWTKQGRLDAAVHCLQEALRIKPSSKDAHVNLGEALARLQQYDAAIKEYEAAIKIDPDLLEAHHNLGMAWARQNRLEDAIPHYERALKIDPDCAEAHANLAVALQLVGRIGEARTHFESALMLAKQQGNESLAENVMVRLRQIAEQEARP